MTIVEWITVGATVGMFVVALIALNKKTDVRVQPQPLSVQGMPPGGDVLARDMKSLGHRVNQLEQWRDEIMRKLEDDKMEILNAGEDRGRRIHERIDVVLTAVSELKGTVAEMRREGGRHR